MTGAPRLEVELTHRVGGRGGGLALAATFTIEAERAALFGPSGAGKTALLRLIAGLERPGRGRVLLDGRVLVDASTWVEPAARAIGFVTQGSALFPHLTVEENVRFGLRTLGNAARRARVGALVERFGLDGLRGRRAERLSGGERQRVALVRALARGPRLLLLDEPFAALDGVRKEETWATLGGYAREHGMGILLVSHDAGEVWARAQVVVRMEAGVVRAQGTPEEMLGEERARVLRLFGG